jgi:hypothetical protein
VALVISKISQIDVATPAMWRKYTTNAIAVWRIFSLNRVVVTIMTALIHLKEAIMATSLFLIEIVKLAQWIEATTFRC